MYNVFFNVIVNILMYFFTKSLVIHLNGNKNWSNKRKRANNITLYLDVLRIPKKHDCVWFVHEFCQEVH